MGSNNKMGLSEARSRFSEILHNAAFAKNRIVLTKSGKDIAAVIPIEDLYLIEEMENRADIQEARKRLRDPKLRPFGEFERELDDKEPVKRKRRTRRTA